MVDIRKALDMLAAFEAVGVRAFNVTLTNIEGRKVGFQPGRGLEQLRRTIGRQIEITTRAQQNFIIRPVGKNPELIQLDDLAAETAAKLTPYAFMVLCTSPGNYQAWVAVNDAPADFARRLKLGCGADPSASGATRISGSRNFKTKYAPAFPLVEISHASAGRVATVDELSQAGFVSPAEEAPRRVSHRVSQRRAGKARRWPSYELCVQQAPPLARSDGSASEARTRVDFTWCMIAIDWGHSPEATAARLMEVSTKAQENGEAYAFTTAANAAAAVERRAVLTAPPGPK